MHYIWMYTLMSRYVKGLLLMHQLGITWGLIPQLFWSKNGYLVLPSGKLTVRYGKSPFLMGKSTINHHFQ